MANNGRLETGYMTTGSIYPAGEVDWFATTYIRGLTYSVKVSGVEGGGGTLGDPTLQLRNASGEHVMFNDDISRENWDAQLTFKVNTTANFQLVVRESGGDATGSYTITNSLGYASNYNDTVSGTGAPDGIAGMAGRDWIFGAGGSDRLFGGDGFDTLIGGAGNDQLIGGNGNDTLRGQGGHDALVGDAGADLLVGSYGADRFQFRSVADSRPGYADRIVAGDGAVAFEGIGVRGGDLLDVSQIDANWNSPGDQEFRWAATYAAGTAHLWNVNGETVFYGHVDNDRRADVVIRIADGGYTPGDYESYDFVL